MIVRVFGADTDPRIGDVVFDPFAAHGRGEIRLADRDLWVTVSPLDPALGTSNVEANGEGDYE